MIYDNVTDIERLRSIAGSLRRGRWLCRGEEAHIEQAATDLATLRKQLENARSEALEEAAAWHDAQANDATEQSKLCKKLAPVSSHNYYNISRDHERHAQSIRALKGQT